MEDAASPAAELCDAIVGAVSCHTTRGEVPPPTTSICPAMDRVALGAGQSEGSVSMTTRLAPRLCWFLITPGERDHKSVSQSVITTRDHKMKKETRREYDTIREETR